MKNILYISTFVPSKKTAGQNFSLNLLNKLSEKHNIDLVVFKDAYYEPLINIKNINIVLEIPLKKKHKILNSISLFFIHPVFTSRFNFKNLFRIKNILKKKHYDLLYLDFSQVFIYGKFINSIDKILMSHDINTQRYERTNSKINLLFCRISEKFVLNQKKSIIYTFSVKDQILIKNLFALDSKVTNFFLDKNIIETKLETMGNYFIFYGAWNRPENSLALDWFVENVLSQVDRNKFVIIGGGLPQKLMEKCTKHKCLNYMGFIENPYQLIASANCLIAPLFHGAGVKVKVIESLACGTPVIGTEIAFEGIRNEFSKYLLNAKNENDFIEKINSFNITLDAKKDLKKLFLETYAKVEILNYINKL